MNQGEEVSLESRRELSGTDYDEFKAKRAAVQFFMANAPPGQLLEVMENCELLIDPNAVSNRFMESALEQSAEEQNHIVTFASEDETSHQAVLCSAGRIGKSQYLHPSTKHVLSVAADGSDLSVSASPAPPEAFPSEFEPYRAALEAQLKEYARDRYACDSLRMMLRVPVDLSQAVAVFSHDRNAVAPSPQLTAVITTLAENKSSCWTCSWTSEWRVFFSPSDPSTEACIEGHVCVRTYLYEDSSVQANFTRHFGRPQGTPEDTNNCSVGSNQDGSSSGSGGGICVVKSTNVVSSPEQFAAELVKAIKSNEETLIKEVDEFFTNRALRVAKRIRRVLPVYGRAFDWKQQSLQLQPHKLSTE